MRIDRSAVNVFVFPPGIVSAIAGRSSVHTCIQLDSVSRASTRRPDTGVGVATGVGGGRSVGVVKGVIRGTAWRLTGVGSRSMAVARLDSMLCANELYWL